MFQRFSVFNIHIDWCMWRFFNRDFSVWGNYHHLCRDVLSRDFSMWGETEVPVEIYYWFYMANVGIFLRGENCHLCRDFLMGTFWYGDNYMGTFGES
jgi:hypothetical protein